MITSIVVMNAFFIKDSLGLVVEDSSTLRIIAKYDFDLDLELGETIYIRNLEFFSDYTSEARIRSKSKILKREVMTTSDDDYSLTIEYAVDIVNPEDLVIIKKRLVQLLSSQKL